jgi:hypothetical protein
MDDTNKTAAVVKMAKVFIKNHKKLEKKKEREEGCRTGDYSYSVKHADSPNLLRAGPRASFLSSTLFQVDPQYVGNFSVFI